MRVVPTGVAVLFWVSNSIPATAQSGAGNAAPPARAEVLVLGVYHMSNPGRDLFNSQADDVLAPKRQAEMAELVGVLKKFNPTRIAVEVTAGDEKLAERYASYVAGKCELTRNEVQQIGFRLARELGHKTVYPVDVDGEFPHLRVESWAKARGRAAELEALMGEIGQMVKEEDGYLASHTLLETLLYMNSDEKVAQSVGFYYREAHFGEAWDWAGAELLAEWYRRNIRIFSNVAQITESPADRVLVIYGAGHLGWLQHDFASDPTFRLRKLAEFVR